MKLILLSITSLLILNNGFSQPIPEDSLYLGQTPPGSIPELFAPGILKNVCVITFSPDGTEIFYDNIAWPHRVIKQMEYKNNIWTSPTTASFSINQYPGEPSFSADGKRLYFYAFPNLSNTGNTDIYYSEKNDSVWGSPISLGGSMVTINWEFHPCIINDSSIYYTNAIGEISKSQRINGVYQKTVKLPFPINYANTSTVYADAYVNPGEDYMIFRSNRNGGLGKFDLYISYKKTDGLWTNPKNLGNRINTAEDEGEGDITPDGNYMTFISNSNLYWVSTYFIDSLKQTNFMPYVKKSINNHTDSLGNSYSLTIPDSTFIDDDGNNTITYSATLSNGNPLPVWLQFNPDTRTFSGSLDSLGTFSIKVTVTDTAEAFISSTFTLKVIANPTEIKQTLEENFQLYPIPTKEKINIDFGSLQYKTAKVEIIDISGKLISSNTYHKLSNATIDMTGNSKGIYILNLNIDGDAINKKICIE